MKHVVLCLHSKYSTHGSFEFCMSEPGGSCRGLGRESDSASRNWDKRIEEECKRKAGSK